MRLDPRSLPPELDDPPTLDDALCDEVDALRAESALAAAEHVTLQRISGILCDAGDVVVEPYPEAVAEVVRQRDKARALLREARQYTYMASSGGSDLNDRIDAALGRTEPNGEEAYEKRSGGHR